MLLGFVHWYLPQYPIGTHYHLNSQNLIFFQNNFTIIAQNVKKWPIYWVASPSLSDVFSQYSPEDLSSILIIIVIHLKTIFFRTNIN